MATYDFEEEERIESLKAWWKENGTYVYIILAAIIFAAIGVTGWKEYQATRADKTAEAYEEFRKVAETNDVRKISEAVEKLKNAYPDSLHAAQAALLAARQSFDAKDLANAEKHLKWAVDKAPSEQLQNIAKTRLATLLLDQKKYNEALKLLDTVKDAAFIPLVSELKGDIYLAQDKPAEARANYKLALSKLDANSPVKPLVQIKLDIVGPEINGEKK